MEDHPMDAAQQRFKAYIDQIGDLLGNEERRASFATYAVGLLAEGERKSMEPIAARACADPEETDALHQRLQHLTANSPWSDHEVRLHSARYALAELEKREPIVAWIIDDTGFLKQGKHSVGVQRQYTGSAGKVTNCQIGVSLGLATNSQQLPVDFELYLPKTWTKDAKRRKEAKIPKDIVFRTKPQQALAMLQRAVADDLPRGIVLADTGYGNSSAFRAEVHNHLGLDFAVAVDPQTNVWQMDRLLRRTGKPLSARALAKQIGGRSFRRVTWREGTRYKLSARFAFRRVVPFHDDGIDPSVREDVWLIMEWEDDEPAPTKYYLATMPPKITRKQLVRIIKLRWRTERMYEDLKGQLGLDHFEGRRYQGWHHHVSVVLCCYAFVCAEQARAFPPSAREENHSGTDRRPTGAPLRRLVHHHPPRHRPIPGRLATAMPNLPSAESRCQSDLAPAPPMGRREWVTQ
jgi:SRSO17 transposase